MAANNKTLSALTGWGGYDRSSEATWARCLRFLNAVKRDPSALVKARAEAETVRSDLGRVAALCEVAKAGDATALVAARKQIDAAWDSLRYVAAMCFVGRAGDASAFRAAQKRALRLKGTGRDEALCKIVTNAASAGELVFAKKILATIKHPTYHEMAEYQFAKWRAVSRQRSAK